MNIEGEKRR